MEENFGRKITLDELSKIAYLSKNFYRTVFCRVMETSPREFLRKLRVRKAIGMLETGELSFGEIAQVCGFENQAYMNCVLKAETGKTPGQIRKGEQRFPARQETKIKPRPIFDNCSST